jgi:hypothetical protein
MNNLNITKVPVFSTGTSRENGNEVETLETWRSVRDFEGVYEVSNLGRVKSLNYRNTGKPGIITPMHRNCDKYLRIALSKKGKKEYRYLHRIVAESFLSNPYNFPEVNHLDTDPRNCKVSNLEWCTRQHNVNYYKTRLNRSKKVEVYDAVTNELISSHASVASCAACLQTNDSYVSYLIRNNKTYKGYILKYKK